MHEKAWYKEHIILTQVKTKSRDELSGHRIIYPTPDGHIIDIFVHIKYLICVKM